VTREGTSPLWTYRSWLLPWVQIALAGGFAASRSPALPVLLCVAALAAVPLLPGPLAHWRWAGWTVLVVCGLWWGASAVSGPAIQGYYQLLRIGGWCLVLLGALQILSLGRGGSVVLVAWCSLGATWLFAGRWSVSGSVVLALQGLLAVESIRRRSAPSGAPGRVVARWALILAILAGFVAVQRAWRGRGRGIRPPAGAIRPIASAGSPSSLVWGPSGRGTAPTAKVKSPCACGRRAPRVS
jgi:hypothetical protein